MSSKHEVARAGISFGTARAITISWSLHKSLLWAGIHGILGWFYVLYYALTRYDPGGPGLPAFRIWADESKDPSRGSSGSGIGTPRRPRS